VLNPPASSIKFPGVPEGKYIDPDLLTVVGPTRVIIIASDSLPLHEVATYMISSRVTPSFKGFHMILGVMEADKVDQLAANPLVYAIYQDRKIEYAISTDSSTADYAEKDVPLLPFGKPQLDLREDELMADPGTTLRDVINITGAERTWTDLGINGTDVTIAIVDTGVDYGALSLGYWDSVARDEKGYPAAFDADAECMVLTNTTVTAYLNNARTFLNTSGTDPNIYFVDPSLGLPIIRRLSELINSTWPYDMEITGIDSLSGTYHFGIMSQHLFGSSDLFPVLVVDSTQPGVYDTVYVDLSFDWWWWNFTTVYDASFSDEIALTPTGRTIAARDFTGDGIYDISAGSLGYFLDIWSVSPNADDRGLVLEPIDQSGNYAVFVNDWWGHGTLCASSVGGRDKGHPLTGPGIAPEVKIMGIVALWIGDIIEAELWAAGFDLIPGTEGWSGLLPGYGWLWGTWNYTGNHKADVISNSWGISDWISSRTGLPWYDMLTIIEDALMIPSYLDPDYPGTVVVHAGGNGAPGYGTFTSPGYATLPISVGASTSFGTTAMTLFNISEGHFDDIISWSAMGPTPLGNVKPDVVNIGAWAMVPGPVWSGLGNGSTAINSFGGTSMATPLTSGVIGLVIQGYTVAYGESPTPEMAKAILKSTTMDIGYDAFLQGSGRVDCFAAVSLAIKAKGVTLTSPITWENVRTRIQYTWFLAHDSLGEVLHMTPPIEPFNDSSWFAGVVRSNDSASAKFTVTNPTNQAITATITPVIHKQVGIPSVYSGNTDTLEGWLEGYGDHLILNASEIPTDTDLMVVTLMVPFIHFDNDDDYLWDSRFRVFILDWIDENENGIVDLTEVSIINYGYDTGTVCEGRVGFPSLKFRGNPVIWVSQVNEMFTPYSQVPYEVHIKYYRRNDWTWVTTPISMSIREDSSESFMANLTIPLETPQGIYEGQIMFNISAPYTRSITIPVSLAVPMVLSSTDLARDIIPPATIELYDPYRVNGHFDWRWRYEAGDWKQWVLDIQDLTTVAAFVSSNWTGTKTDIDMIGINPMGVLIDQTLSPHLGDGRFKWQTRTGTTDEYVVLRTTAFTNPLMGVYTILLHNVLFDGTLFPETLTGRIELVKLEPRETNNLATRSGQSAVQNFTLITGRNLTNVAISTSYPFTPFPVVEISPSSIPAIAAQNSTEFTVKVDVPKDTPENTYKVIINFTSNELPFLISAGIDITVDNTPPTVTVVFPKNESIIGGNITIKVNTIDPGGIETVEYMTENTLHIMNSDNITGHWIGSLDTSMLPFGENIIKILATDRAGNSFNETVTVFIDNTAPTVRITSPEAETQLNGTITLEFNASDPHLELAQLLIDNSVFTVTGETSYEWNTKTVGDGIHTIRLEAYDKAGNKATTHVIVTTTNVQKETEEVYETGKNFGMVIGGLIGLIIGAIGGAIVVLAIARRRERANKAS
jgi:subtilisin family serine protease